MSRNPRDTDLNESLRQLQVARSNVEEVARSNVEEVVPTYEQYVTKGFSQSQRESTSVSTLLADFGQVFLQMKVNPDEFMKRFDKIRVEGAELFKDDPDALNIFNMSYARLAVFIGNQYNMQEFKNQSIINKFDQESRAFAHRKTKMDYYGSRAGQVSRAATVGGISHGVPVALGVFGLNKLSLISEIIAGAVNTVNSYAKDPTGSCVRQASRSSDLAEYQRILIERATELIEPVYREALGPSGWITGPVEQPALKKQMITAKYQELIKETPFQTSSVYRYFDSAACSIFGKTTGVLGSVLEGAHGISDAAMSIVSVFMVIAFCLMLWALIQKTLHSNVPFFNFFGVVKNEQIREISSKLPLKDRRKAKNVIKDAKRIAKQTRAPLIVQDQIIQEEISNVNISEQVAIEAEGRRSPERRTQGPQLRGPANMLSQIQANPRLRHRSRSPPQRRRGPANMLSQIKSNQRAHLRHRSQSPRSRSSQQSSLERAIHARRKYIEHDDDDNDNNNDWDFGRRRAKRSKRRRSIRKSRRRKSRRRKSRKRKSRKRKSRRRKSRRRKSRRRKSRRKHRSVS